MNKRILYSNKRNNNSRKLSDGQLYPLAPEGSNDLCKAGIRALEAREVVIQSYRIQI